LVPTDTSNFNAADGSVAVLVKKTTLLVTANNQSMTYGAPLQAYTYTITGFVNGDTQANAVSGATSLTSSPAQPVNAGTYTITAAQGALEAANYVFTFAPGTLTINKANASVTANSSTKVYGTADPALTGTLTGFLPSDNVVANYSRVAGETVSGAPYAIFAVLSPTSALTNYNITYNSAAFTITQAAASVTPNAASKVYGTADPALTGTVTGFLSSDNVTAAYSRAAGETVSGGPYAIGAVLSPGPVLSNYNITYNTAPFTITQAAASVTPNAASKVYVAADLAPTGTLTGFLPFDNVVATYSRVAGERVTGGPYAITAVLSSTSALSNYNITYNTAPFNITPAPASMTSNSATKTYGTADPVLTGTLTGFRSADNVTATYSRTPGEIVAGGPYTISAALTSTGELSNYTITYNTALFTITKETPVVTWNPSAVVYGAPLGSAQLNATTTIPGSWAYSPGSGTVLSAGNHTLSVTFTPTDSSDYTPASQTATVKVQYSLNACLGDLGHSILQPINANGTSTFKQGSTVPAKFRVCDASGNSVGSAGLVTSINLVQTLYGTVTQSVDDTVASTTPDNSFRWDPTAQQWVFNISTKGLSTSTTYVYAIGLNDGSTIRFQYGLPK
jgi:hypothetical protein